MNRRVIGAGLLVGALIVASPVTAGATAAAESVRVAGTDRYGTANGVAASAFEDVSVAVVASGEGFADALAANYLAGAIGAPIILTPQGRMDPGLPGALEAIGAEGVQLIGGTNAVSDGVLAEIQAEGYEVTRLAGSDRYTTARAIAELIPAEAVGELGENGRTAIIVNGASYPDALAAGPMSYAQGWPILLSGPDRLHPEARGAIETLGIDHVIIVGGVGVIADGVSADLTGIGVTSQRLSGTDRTVTAQAVANFVVDVLGYGGDDVVLARGDDFPDALAAGARAGDELMPVLLTVSPTNLGAAAAAWITDNRDVLDRIEVFGGTAAISEAVASHAVSLAREP